MEARLVLPLEELERVDEAMPKNIIRIKPTKDQNFTMS